MSPRYPLALSYLLGATSLSAAAGDWPVTPDRASIAYLPTVMFGRATDFAPHPASQFSLDRTTPVLDQLITGREIGSRSIARRGYRFDLAGGRARIETLRFKAGLSNGATAGFGRKSWSLGGRSEWSLGTEDRVSIGFGTGSFHPVQRGAVLTNPHDATALSMVGANWAHGEHWQAGVAWQQVGGSTHGAADRMVQLANGAPLHEAGLRLSAAFVPGGQGDPHRTSIGFEARRASISAGDLVQMNADQRQDTQGSLVIRSYF